MSSGLFSHTSQYNEQRLTTTQHDIVLCTSRLFGNETALDLNAVKKERDGDTHGTQYGRQHNTIHGTSSHLPMSVLGGEHRHEKRRKTLIRKSTPHRMCRSHSNTRLMPPWILPHVPSAGVVVPCGLRAEPDGVIN